MPHDPNGLGCVGAARAALGVLHIDALAALPAERRAVAVDALSAIDHQLNRLAFALGAPSVHDGNLTQDASAGKVTAQ